jgi:ABC-type glutathione transport system ATPase component
MSDRVIVMYHGRIRAQFDHDEVDREKIMSLATGVEGSAPQVGTNAPEGESI